jgi:hypothetical protein
MTDKINDWADEIARGLTDNWTYSHGVDSSKIAAALRKAKADGERNGHGGRFALRDIDGLIYEPDPLSEETGMPTTGTIKITRGDTVVLKVSLAICSKYVWSASHI